MKPLILQNRSIILACDVSFQRYKKILKETARIDGVGAYKIGFTLALLHGLPKIVEVTRKYTEKQILYDHQKAGGDIPDMGKAFAKTCKKAGVDAVILFPHAGPSTERAWIEAAQKEGLGVIVGGSMTHAKYRKSEGGFIADEAIEKIYLIAGELGVTDFVVPGNKPHEVAKIKSALENKGIIPTFYAPGFIKQGGMLKRATAMGSNWHVIIGRGIYEAKNIRKQVLNYTKQLGMYV